MCLRPRPFYQGRLNPLVDRQIQKPLFDLFSLQVLKISLFYQNIPGPEDCSHKPIPRTPVPPVVQPNTLRPANEFKGLPRDGLSNPTALYGLQGLVVYGEFKGNNKTDKMWVFLKVVIVSCKFKILSAIKYLSLPPGWHVSHTGH